MRKPLHVLQCVPDMNAGGLENFIMNIYRSIDRSEVQFDFLMHHSYDSFFDDEIRGLGGSIYRYPVVENKNLPAYSRYVKNLLISHPEIGAVHSHMCSTAYFTLGAAKRAGCVMRVAHSHSTSHDHTVKGCAKWALSRLAPLNASMLLACSTEAGRYLFGNRPFALQRNAIDTSRFEFDPQKRMETRASLGIGGELVVGHVGRFTEAKNHPFIVRTFAKIKQIRPDAKLVLVGDGEADVKASVFALVERLRLGGDVVFAGVCSAPEHYYSAFDVFLFPSLFEGLPLTGIEAQCSGLPCLFSENITKELGISEYASFLSLSEGEEGWARAAVEAASATSNRSTGLSRAREAGYDAVVEADRLQALYLAGANSD